MEIVDIRDTVTFQAEGSLIELEQIRSESGKRFSRPIEITFPKINDWFGGSPPKNEAKMTVTCLKENFEETKKFFEAF